MFPDQSTTLNQEKQIHYFRSTIGPEDECGSQLMRRFYLLITVILFALGSFGQVSSDAENVLQLDRAFAHALLTDRQAIANYTDNTSFVVVGSQALRDFFATKTSFARLTLSPQESKIVSPNRLAYTSGAFDYTYRFAKCNCSVAEHGTYMEIWKHEKGAWKLVAFIPSLERHVGCGCSD
jgi:hypothetical protein